MIVKSGAQLNVEVFVFWKPQILHRNNKYLCKLVSISNLYWKLETIIVNIDFRLQTLVFFTKCVAWWDIACLYNYDIRKFAVWI